MKDLLKVDLRVARQHSGLLGSDVAILLGMSRARLSKLENGYARPKVKELIGLSLIYDKPIGELFRLTSSRLTAKIEERLGTLGDLPANIKRSETLATLHASLDSLNNEEDAA